MMITRVVMGEDDDKDGASSSNAMSAATMTNTTSASSADFSEESSSNGNLPLAEMEQHNPGIDCGDGDDASDDATAGERQNVKFHQPIGILRFYRPKKPLPPSVVVEDPEETVAEEFHNIRVRRSPLTVEESPVSSELVDAEMDEDLLAGAFEMSEARPLRHCPRIDWGAYERSSRDLRVRDVEEGNGQKGGEQPENVEQSEDLPEANPIAEAPIEEVPIAEEVGRLQPTRDDGRRRLLCIFATSLSCLALTIVPIILFVVVTQPPPEPPLPHPPRDPLKYMTDLLRSYNVPLIELEDGSSSPSMEHISPQAKAFNWTMHDPNWHDASVLPYPDWKLVERFALVCLYYSTDGDSSWVTKKDWLSYDVDESEWCSNSALLSMEKHVNESLLKEFWHQVKDHVETFLSNTQTKELNHLWLASNGLKGTIPPEFYLLTSLRSVDFLDNDLVGTIASEIGNLGRLQAISFKANNMTGAMPTTIGNLSNLLALDVSENKFESIPSEIGLIDPWFLNFGFNSLSGTFPKELANCKHLTSIWLHNNRLTSTTPTELASLQVSLTTNVKAQVCGIL